MKKSDVICSECDAGFRRLEFWSQPGEKGEYRCPACDTSLETFDGSRLIAYRLTIEPSVRAMRD
ncbi:hypothetical protein QA640_31430 [Bradyrhizobium sp. CB82]|uniref:hypothetical protein n=1 Tax=Bradyrhizobium sp. CB82 TaxID=3039159 RepID=UPI0024B23F91|nr:hypothetical protein [Bradyrhizobium sp. CB82]WFU38882.1 hypothetical protein QA640_31430 [Bradyrhizobium sp. CB82]